MTDDAKLGLVAGVLAVVGVAVIGLPKETPKPPAEPAAQVVKDVAQKAAQ